MAPSQRASMRMSRISFVVAMIALSLLLLNSITAYAQCSGASGATCAYVTDYNGREILRAVFPPGSATPTLTTVYSFTSRGAFPEDLTVGPNGKLYVALTSSNSIWVVDLANPNTSGSIYNGATKPQGIRFNWKGDLYFNSANGVYRLNGTSSPATQVAAASFTNPGGIAFLSDGSLIFGGESNGAFKIYKKNAVNGLPTDAVVDLTATLTLSGRPVGLAIDSVDNIYVANGQYLTRLPSSNGWTAADWNISFNFGADLPQHIEAVPDSVNGATCNTINDLVWVSTYQLSSGTPVNGKVWRVSNTTAVTPATGKVAQCGTTASPATNTPVAVATKVSGKFVPAIGLGVGPSYRTLTKEYPNLDQVGFDTDTHTYNFGRFTHELRNDLFSLPQGQTCLSSVTEEQKSPAEIGGLVSLLGATPIALWGEQGWITTFKLSNPACFNDETGKPVSDHYLSGFFTPVNPKVVNIVDGPPTSAAYSTLFGYYPTAGSLEGTPGDPGVWNRGSDRLVLVNQNAGNNTYYFCGFSTPVRDPVANQEDPVENSFNFGQNITFKFQLSKNPNCNSTISDAEAALVQTVFALARVNPGFERELDVDASGNSIKLPPSFKYDSRNNQFLYTLDSGTLSPTGRSIFEATVSSPNFDPHAVRFYLVP